MATTASVYNTSRTTRQILRRHRKDKPSLILHLHNNHFRFERQNGMFLFDSPVKAFLGYIRDQKVPADLIDVLTDSGVQFFEGCLLVDVHDHRSHAAAAASSLGPRELHSMSATGGMRARDDNDPSSMSVLGRASEGGLASSLFYLQEGGRYGARKLLGGPGSSDSTAGALGGVEVYRIVLHPTSETLWTDIKMLDHMTGGIWSDQEALEVEAKILALTAPPLCLTPDAHVTRIANLMLSSTALPSAYNPSQDSPFRAAKKRGANSIEMEREEANRQRREKIMRLMQHGHKSVLQPPGAAGSGVLPGAASRSAMVAGEPGATASGAAASAFMPTFGRMGFIERWRMGRNAALGGALPAAGAPATAANGLNPAVGANAKSGKDATKAGGKESATDAANDSNAKKPPSKKKKKAQREKEEAEAAAAAEAAKKKAEEEAAAAAAAAKKPKKKLTKKEREEKERKEKEEKEKAEKEEKERKEKEAAAAAANAKGAKGKSKKKQKEEAAAAAAEMATKSPAKSAKAAGANTAANGTDAPGSPDKDKKGSPKKTAAKKPAVTTPAPAPASASKKKTPAKADKKNAIANGTPIGGAANGAIDLTANAPLQGTPILGSATPSVQSTPTPAHRSIPSQPQPQPQQPHQQQQQQQQQQLQMQQQQQQLTQQQLQQAALAGMFPNMQGQLPFGANPGGFGLPMMNNNGMGVGFPPTSNPQATAAALAAMQGMGLGQFGATVGSGLGMGQMQQMMGMMNGGFNGLGFPGQQPQQQGMLPQGQGQQQGQQQGAGQATGDMPVGVGLAGLANWGTGK